MYPLLEHEMWRIDATRDLMNFAVWKLKADSKPDGLQVRRAAISNFAMSFEDDDK